MTGSLEHKGIHFCSRNAKICVCMLNVCTCFNRMAEDQNKESKDCSCSEKNSQNPFEMYLMVKLDEICWLRNRPMWIPSLKSSSPSLWGRSWWGREQRGWPERGRQAKVRQTGWGLPEVEGTMVISTRSKHCRTVKQRILFVVILLHVHLCLLAPL